MVNLDDALQEQLTALEHGISLEKVLADLPSEAGELASLIVLATLARAVPHPRLRPEVVRTQQNRLAAAVQAHQPRNWWPSWIANLRLPYALAGGFAVLVVVAAAVVGINMLFSSVSPVQAANLVNVNGLVEVSTAMDGSDWHFVSAGESVRQGQRIHTYAGSSVTLAFFEGSRTTVGPDTDLVLTDLKRGSSGDLQVLMTQNNGSTANEVVPFRSTGSSFQVDTPFGMAIVHGTSFNVDVSSKGVALFAVTHGRVQVKNAGSNVYLDPGQATSALDGLAIEKPGYQFTLRGAIQSMSGETWTVNNVAFKVTQDTDVLGDYLEGNSVSVKGRILNGGDWVADRIEPNGKDQLKSSFTGVIENLGGIPGNWTISGREVQVDSNTELDPGLAPNSPVEVTFTAQPDNGPWQATEIISLEAENPKIPPTATETFTPTVEVSTETPTETETETYTPTPTEDVSSLNALDQPTPTVAPKNEDERCLARTEQQPEGLRLADRYKVTYDEIIDWYCKGFGFGEIDLAYSLSQSSGMAVSDLFAMRSAGQSWGDIKKDVTANPKNLEVPTPKVPIKEIKPSKTPRK